MKHFSSKGSVKWAALVLGIILVVSPLATNQASAQVAAIGSAATTIAQAVATPQDAATPNLLSCLLENGNVATCSIITIATTINSVQIFFTTIGGYFLESALRLNEQVYEGPIVPSGFSISLTVANLGFILAIIIMAIATMLRNETY